MNGCRRGKQGSPPPHREPIQTREMVNENSTNPLLEFCQRLQEPVPALWMRPGAGMLVLSRRRAGGEAMGGRSLGWGARKKGRRMSGEMRVGGQVEEMPSFFWVFLRRGGGMGVLFND